MKDREVPFNYSTFQYKTNSFREKQELNALALTTYPEVTVFPTEKAISTVQKLNISPSLHSLADELISFDWRIIQKIISRDPSLFFFGSRPVSPQI